MVTGAILLLIAIASINGHGNHLEKGNLNLIIVVILGAGCLLTGLNMAPWSKPLPV